MTTDAGPTPTPSGDGDANAWLDGLAGRDGSGSDFAEGVRIRRALLAAEVTHPAAALGAPDWAALEARAAGAELPATPGTGPASPPSATGPARPAANDARWRPALGWAAALVLGSALVVAWAPWRTDAPGEGLRGVGAADQAARWQVANPSLAAKGLADELRALGAQVQEQPQADGGVLLSIAATPAAQPAVGRRLQDLETALDANGRLVLKVVAP